MKKIIFLLSFVVLLGGWFGVFAQENKQEENNLKTEMYIMADVSMDNLDVTNRKGNELTIEFDLINKEDRVQSNLSTVIEAVKIEGENKQFEDITAIKDSFSIKGNETIHKKIIYAVPYSFNGDYDLNIEVANQAGVTMATSTIEFLDLRFNEGVTIDANSCYLTINNEEKKYSLDQGVDLLPEEQLFLTCDKVKNNLKEEIKFVPHFETYRRSVHGELMFESNDEESDIQGEEEESMGIFIPIEQNPQSYTTLFSLYDFNGIKISNAIPIHYVIIGESATVTNVTLDKDRYQKGEEAEVDVVIASSAHSFPNRRHQEIKKDEQRVLNIDIVDDKKQTCLKDKVIEDMDLTKTVYKEKVLINKECDSATAVVTISTKKGQELTKAEFNTGIKDQEVGKTDSSPVGLFSNKKIIAILMGILMIVIIFFFILRRFKNKHIAILLFLVSISFFGIANGAKGKTADLYTYFAAGPLKGKEYSHIYVYYDSTKSEYECDEDVKAKYQTRVTTCNNTSFTGRLKVDGHILEEASRSSLGGHNSMTYDSGVKTYSLGKKSTGFHSMGYSLYWTDSQGTINESDTVNYSVKKCLPKPACGVANNGTYNTRPSWSKLCSQGSYEWIDSKADDGIWNWKCKQNGVDTKGSAVFCSAKKRDNGNPICGPADGREYTSKPTTGLCGSGDTATSVYENTSKFWWNCNGHGGSVGCEAKKKTVVTPPPPPPSTPQCGSAANTSATSCPTSNLCSSGSVINKRSTYDTCLWECRSSDNKSHRTCSSRIVHAQNKKQCEVNFVRCGSAVDKYFTREAELGDNWRAAAKSLCEYGMPVDLRGYNPFYFDGNSWTYEAKNALKGAMTWKCVSNSGDHTSCRTKSWYPYSDYYGHNNVVINTSNRKDCGSAQADTFLQGKPSDKELCLTGKVRWIDSDGSDGTYNWQCEYDPLYVYVFDDPSLTKRNPIRVFEDYYRVFPHVFGAKATPLNEIPPSDAYRNPEWKQYADTYYYTLLYGDTWRWTTESFVSTIKGGAPFYKICRYNKTLNFEFGCKPDYKLQCKKDGQIIKGGNMKFGYRCHETGYNPKYIDERGFYLDKKVFYHRSIPLEYTSSCWAYSTSPYGTLHQQVINMPIGNLSRMLNSREVSEMKKNGTLCSDNWEPDKVYIQWTGDSYPSVYYDSVAGLYTWICLNSSSHYGTKRSTNYAYNGQVCNSICGSSDGQTFSKRPLTDLCSEGASAGWTDTSATDGSWNWSCSKGNIKQKCSATKQTCSGKYEYYCQLSSGASCDNKCGQEITQLFVPVQICSTDNTDMATISKSEYDNNRLKHALGEPDTCVDKQIKCPACNGTIYETN